jgi:hypothetical protein
MDIENGGTGETTDQVVFKYRTAAAKKVFQRMSEDDQAKIYQTIEDDIDIIPPELKQR